jgi:hypothetical protein
MIADEHDAPGLARGEAADQCEAILAPEVAVELAIDQKDAGGRALRVAMSLTNSTVAPGIMDVIADLMA